jgi:hypothetical protein
MKDNVESGKEDETNGGRPTIVSIVSVVIFLLGSVGLLLATIAWVGSLFLRLELPSFTLLAIMFWFVAGPCLILAGYNLWKRKKWAAQLTMAIILFDLITAIVRGYIFTSVLDMITLASIGLTWKHLQ